MAAPVASGVAALVWAYHPDLSATEMREILMTSVTKLEKKKVIKPGTKNKVWFSELSSTGGIINAYKCLHLS